MFILFKFYIHFLNLPDEEDHLEPYFCLPALLWSYRRNTIISFSLIYILLIASANTYL